MLFGTAQLGDFGSHDFTDHFPDVPPQEVAKDLAGFGRANLPERLQKTKFLHHGRPVDCRRRELRKAGIGHSEAHPSNRNNQ